MRTRPIDKLDLEGNFIASYKSSKEVEDLEGINRNNICRAISGYKTCGGFRWRYSSTLTYKEKTPPEYTKEQSDFLWSNFAKHKNVIHFVINKFPALDDFHIREEIVQLVRIEVWKNFFRFDYGCTFSNWLYRQVSNVCIKYYDAVIKKKVPLVEEEYLIFIPEPVEEESSLIDNLRMAIDSLPEDDQRVVNSYLLYGNCKEAAIELELTEPAVRCKLHRIRTKIRSVSHLYFPGFQINQPHAAN